MYYKKIMTKERLPAAGGYYAIETDKVIGHVHWSSEKRIWTLPDGTVWDATHPNCWLSPFVFNRVKVGDVREWINQYLSEEITLSRLTELVNNAIANE